MPSRLLVSLLTPALVLLAACDGSKDEDPTTTDTTETTETTDDTTDTGGEPTDTTDDTGSTDDTGTLIDTDTGTLVDTDTGTAKPSSPVADLDWSVNEHVSTLIEVSFTLEQDAEVWLTWQTDEGEEQSSPQRALSAGENSEVLLGIPSETTVSVTVYAIVDDFTTGSEVIEATTGALPEDLQDPDLVVEASGLESPEGYLLTSVEVGPNNFFGPYYPVILDREGRIVWYREYTDDRLTLFPRTSIDGDHVVFDTTSIYQFGEVPEINRLTLDHRMEENTLLPNWTLTYAELPDGTILYDESTSNTHFYLNARYPDGTSERLWDCEAWLRTIKMPGYWECMPNTIAWNPDTNTVLWSMFQTSTIAEVDLDSGEVIRQFGALDGSWEFDPVDSALNLQHFPSYTDDGTLIVSTHGPGADYDKQYAREFSLDDETGTLTEIWRYQNDLGYYAEYAGEAKRLDNGNSLVGFGTAGAILEVDADGVAHWGVEWTGRLLGQATLIDDLYALNEGW